MNMNERESEIMEKVSFSFDACFFAFDFFAFCCLFFLSGVIRGISKEKEQALAEFKDALRHGQTAALLDREEGDLFACEIGNLGANEDCIIRIKSVALLFFPVPSLLFSS